jgi:hypothetical protein
MELSPMRVFFKGVDVGGTLGNATVSLEYTKSDILADQSGSTVRDRRVSGMKITVATELAEIRNKDIWKIVFPHAQLITDGITGLKSIRFINKIGDSDLDNSGLLRLHPMSRQDSDLSGDYNFLKACADAKSEIVYGPTEQAKLKVTWNILPDDSVYPEAFFTHGDPTIGRVAASFGTPTYTGTGTGTLTGETVYDGITKTETVTARCIAASANGGIFQVNGSLSGFLGNAVVGQPFSSSVVSFQINDGTTDFVVGDQFTLPLVSSNYA